MDNPSILVGDDLFKFMEPHIIAELGQIKLNRRTILFFSALSGYGKTATAIQLMHSAICKGNKVLFFDADDQKIVMRQIPNLFSKLMERKKEEYSKLFIYGNNFEETTFFEMLDQHQPKMIVIDNIYNPFIKKYPKLFPMDRAKKIKIFCIKFRDYVSKHDISAIITTPAIKHGKTLMHLGGDIVKGISNTKYFIKIPPDLKNEEHISKKRREIRIFIRDNIEEIPFYMEPDGELIPITDCQPTKASDGKKYGKI
jgi:hypothetical protein